MFCRVLSLLICTGAVPCWAQFATDAIPLKRDDAVVYRKIDELRRATAGLRIDGRDRDWRGVPKFGDVRGDAGEDSRRDIVAVAIALTKDHLALLLRTAAEPSTERWVFYFQVDMFGTTDNDFRIEVESPQRAPGIRLFDPDMQLGEPRKLLDAKVAARDVLELRVPYREIAAALPEDQAELVNGPKARPWVRVQAQTWNAESQQWADFGPAVAGFRLIQTPYPLDVALPQRPYKPWAVDLPVRGEWFVSQAAFGRFSHQDIWAYDLVIVDETGRQSKPPDSKKNADYYAWEQPVSTPVAGLIHRVRSDAEDVPAGEPPRSGAPPNEVLIDAGERYGLNLLHLKQGSLKVKRGDRVRVGQGIGLVGNSGFSRTPHLHVALWHRDKTVPLAFRNVRVGLNPGPHDPWAREFSAWEPREGYFVETSR